MDEFLDEMDDEQVDDLLQPVEGEDKTYGFFITLTKKSFISILYL